MALGDAFQRTACGIHAVAERNVAEIEKGLGGGADRRHNDERCAVHVFRNDSDGPLNRLGILQRCPTELHDDHAAPPTIPRATTSSALSTEPPAAPRTVL